MSNSASFRFNPKCRLVLQAMAGAGLGAAFGSPGIGGHAQAAGKKVDMGFLYAGPRAGRRRISDMAQQIRGQGGG